MAKPLKHVTLKLDPDLWETFKVVCKTQLYRSRNAQIRLHIEEIIKKHGQNLNESLFDDPR